MEKLLPTVKLVLASTPKRWKGLVSSFPIEQLTRRPAAEEWSAVECLQHLIDTEHVLHFRLGAFLAHQDFPAFNPETEGSQVGESTPAELAEEFASLRATGLAILDKLETADLFLAAKHAELGMVTLNEMLHEWVGHDLNHTIQGERALMQPYIQGCGPWQIYFTDQVIK